jgi:hypothetical protein
MQKHERTRFLNFCMPAFMLMLIPRQPFCGVAMHLTDVEFRRLCGSRFSRGFVSSGLS